MGLEEDAVDLGEVDGLDAIAGGLEECAEAEAPPKASSAASETRDEARASSVTTTWRSPVRSSSAWMKARMSSGASLRRSLGV